MNKLVYISIFNYIKKHRMQAFFFLGSESYKICNSILQNKEIRNRIYSHYESIVFVGNKSNDDIMDVVEENQKVSMLWIDEVQYNTMLMLQRTFFAFSNVFFMDTEGFDDDSYEGLLTEIDDSKERYILQVVIGGMGLPLSGHVKEYQKINYIDWNRHIELTSQDFLNSQNLKEYAKEKIESLISQKKICTGDTVYLYGASKLTEEIIGQFGHYFQFIIIDNNIKKQGIRNDGIEVVGAKTVLDSKVDEKIFITVLDYKKVCQEFVNEGYDFPEQIIPIRYNKDYLDMTFDEALEDMENQLARWEKAYDEIRRTYLDEFLFINPHVSGDVYLSCLYLDGYITENKITKYVYLVANKAAQKVAELFGVTAVIYDKEKLFDIVSWGRSKGFEKTKIKKMHPAIGKQRGLWQFVMDIDYNTMMQKWIFNSRKRRTMPKLNQENSDYLFEKYNLKKGRTVIIAPYSNSVDQMDIELFREIVDRLIENGFSVCTNIAGKEEALSNTTGIFLPYINSIDFVNKAGYFIGARSGLCDVISTTSAKMVVLYRKDTYKHFSLVEMGLKTNSIKEIIIDRITKEEMRDTIDKFVCEEGEESMRGVEIVDTNDVHDSLTRMPYINSN